MFYQIKCYKICALIWKEIWQLSGYNDGTCKFLPSALCNGESRICVSDARLCKSLTGNDANSVPTRERNAAAEKSVICELGEKSSIFFSGINDRGLLKLI